MTGKTISIHSARGGTGKTVIATNLAAILANKGFNVALLDLDFRAPSLSIIFSNAIEGSIDCWLNDFFNGACKEDKVMLDISGSYDVKGTLLIGLANPSVEAIRSIMGKSSAWEVTAVKKLFTLLSKLFNDMHIDYCIVDTSPGVQYSSINSAVSSDLTVIITTLDSLDLKGSENMLLDLYDALERKAVVLVNKYSPESRMTKSVHPAGLSENVEGILKHQVIGMIPCFCDVLQKDRASIMALETPDHPFVRKLEEIVEKLEKTVGN